MSSVTNDQFHGWLKAAVNMKLSSDASILHITYKWLTNFYVFTGFDREGIEYLGKSYSKTIDAIIYGPLNGIQA